MLGFEESFGYLIKPFVRDKDAIQAVLIVAEIAAYYRSRGMTLADGIEEIYKQYGYFAEKTISVTPVSYTHLDVYKRQVRALPWAS